MAARSMEPGIAPELRTGDGPGQLSPRANAELLVHPGEIPLDRLRAQEQQFANLSVRLAFRCQCRDSAFRRGELHEPGRRTTRACQLGRRPVGPEQRSEPLEAVARGEQRSAAGGLTLPAAFDHAEGNSDSHVKTSLFGPGLTLLIENGEPMLGTWQSIYLAEWDGPRMRTVAIRILDAD